MEQTREKRKIRRRPEQGLQRLCVQFLRYQYPEALFFHPFNGGQRSKIEAAIYKGLGVLPGVSDLIILEPSPRGFNGACIELKAGRGKLSDYQKQFQERARDRGYFAESASSLDQFIKLIKYYFKDE